MIDTPIQKTLICPQSLCSRGQSELSRPANLRLKLETQRGDPGAKAASLRRIPRLICPEFQPPRSENEPGQLIERVEDFQAHEDERCVHQIKAKMHEGLKNQILLAARADFAARPQTKLNMRCERTSARRTLRRQDELVVSNWKQKASAAAEVMPLSRTSS